MKKQYKFSFLGRRKYARDMEIYHMSPRYEAYTDDEAAVMLYRDYDVVNFLVASRDGKQIQIKKYADMALEILAENRKIPCHIKGILAFAFVMVLGIGIFIGRQIERFKNRNVDYNVILHHERIELKTIEGKTVYSGTFNPDSNSIEQAIINDNL